MDGVSISEQLLALRAALEGLPQPPAEPQASRGDQALAATYAGASLGVEIITDPEPERNAFIRSDQYSFIKRGIPALSLKTGFVKGSPEHETIKRWRAERYHAPSDDLGQPVNFQAAADFNRVYLRIVEEVANRPTRPRWNSDSYFAPSVSASPSSRP